VASYQIHFAPSFVASLRELTKRYPRAPKTVNPALESLKQHPEAGSAIPGWRRRVWKLRINSKDINRGKRFGFRLIYYLEGTTIYPLIIYAKTSKADVANQEIMHALRAMGKGPENRSGD
jgi:mRNA-degrading endonuclease RelE of RelBE toxin-antitoxin system